MEERGVVNRGGSEGTGRPCSLRAWDEPGVLKAFDKCWLLLDKCWLLLEGLGKF